MDDAKWNLDAEVLAIGKGSSPALPLSDHNSHRPLRATDDLEQILTWQEERTMSDDLVVQYKQAMYLEIPSPDPLKIKRKRVRV